MSEEQNKLNVFELFNQSQMTYIEAEEKAKKEAGRVQVERFRIGDDGEYPLRILPLAPIVDENGNMVEMQRKGYEYPIFQQFIAIDLPKRKKDDKVKSINIPVIRTTAPEVGYSVDLIDTYVKIAKEMYSDDTELIDKMEQNSYRNKSSLKWNYQHAIYIRDVSSDKSRAKGPQIWQCSHTVYKAIDNAKMRLWAKMYDKNPKATDPVAGITNAYDVSVIRDGSGKKTEYTVEIGRDYDDLEEDEIKKLLEMPRIPEVIYRFARYHMEAELVFLKQYDEKHDIDVCSQDDFKDAVEKLKGELPADDNSHFDMASVNKTDSKAEEVTVASLWNEYDKLTDEGYDEKSDEYQDFREKLRQFAEDNELDVRLPRSKSNKQFLDEIEEAFEDKQQEVSKSKRHKDDDEEDDEPKKDREDKEERSERRHSRRSEDRDEDEGEGKKDAEKSHDEDEEEERPRRRRPRPVDDVEDDDKDEDKKSDKEDTDDEPDEGEKEDSKKEEPSDNDEEERPVHRRRRR